MSSNTGNKQERYLSKATENKDLIDQWAERMSHEEFRAVMFAQVEKYNTRLGKKDVIVNEVTKMHDYMNRWLEYEEEWSGHAHISDEKLMAMYPPPEPITLTTNKVPDTTLEYIRQMEISLGSRKTRKNEKSRILTITELRKLKGAHCRGMQSIDT